MKAQHTKECTSETNQGRAGPVFGPALAAAAGLISVSTLSTPEGKACREAKAKATGRT
jgi:hypothetical protein